jgi:hypothetical protein
MCWEADSDTALLNLREIFERLKVANLKLKANKCFLFQTKIKYLGHVVSEEGVECDPEKIVDARDWPEQKSKTELKSYLGFCGYYRKFIENFSEIAHAEKGKVCVESELSDSILYIKGGS